MTVTYAANLEHVARATACGVRARVKRKASRQRVRAVTILRGFVDDDSRIVRIFAMQALADLAEPDEQMRRWLRPLLAKLPRTGTPAMRSSGRKLLARLEQPGLSRRPTGGIGGAMTRAGKDAVL